MKDADRDAVEHRRPGHVYDPATPIPEHLRPAAEQAAPSRFRDRDHAELAFRVKTIAWTIPAMPIGILAGSYYASQTGRSVLLCVVVGAMLCGVVVVAGTLMISEGFSRVGGSILFGSGSSVRARREYSLAQSLVARGRFDDAVAEYGRNIAAYPDDPEPCLRLARLQRDLLKRPADAAQSFRRALSARGITNGDELFARRELIELYIHTIAEPRRALPELARIADRFANTPDAEWARRELTSIKRALPTRDD